MDSALGLALVLALALVIYWLIKNAQDFNIQVNYTRRSRISPPPQVTAARVSRVYRYPRPSAPPASPRNSFPNSPQNVYGNIGARY